MTSEPNTTEQSPREELILKHKQPVNGMISIKIDNLDTYWRHNTIDTYYHHRFTLFYKFNDTPHISLTAEPDLDDQHINRKQFDANYIESDNTFQLKVPLRLLSYNLQYILQYRVFEYFEASDAVLFDVTSTNYSVQIPSILIESSYNIGDVVLYNVEGCGFVRHGVIIEMKTNNMILIGRLYDKAEDESKTLCISSSSVYSQTQEAQFVVDLTDRIQMESDLIIRSNDADIQNIYSGLCNTFKGICYENKLFETEDNMHHCNYMATLLATYVCEFLYQKDYNYRFECIFCDRYLFYNNQWKFSVNEYMQQTRNGIQMTEIQQTRECMGYSCDICRVELSWYEFSYHCYGRTRHDFCVSCIYSLLTQQNEMKSYLSNILKGRVTDDCILEIVKFCAGNVQRF